jgi:hypothetical protein
MDVSPGTPKMWRTSYARSISTIAWDAFNVM